MRRAIGLVLVLIGLTPAASLLWLSSRHMYTVGISADTRGINALLLLTVADLSCLCGGFYLLLRQRFSRVPRWVAWMLLVVGCLVTAWPLYVLEAFFTSLRRFGDIPWSWGFLFLNAGHFPNFAHTLIAGLLIAGFAAIMIVRTHRKISN